MARPRAKELPVYTRNRFRPLKDGTTAVDQVEYQYDYALKNNKILKQKTIGYLPEGCTDLKDMIPAENPKRGPKPGTRKKKEPEKNISAENPLVAVQDTRDLKKVTYPSYIAYIVLIMCAGAGMLTAPQIAEFWNVHHKELKRVFPDCPDSNISHDTIRDFFILLGKTDSNAVIKAFNAMLLLEEGVLHELEKMNTPEAMEAFQKTIYALDGQAVRATKVHNGSKHPKYILSIYDCNKELVVAQTLVNEKTNEIPHGREVVSSIDISGGIVTADALHAQFAFTLAVIEAMADYCLGLKGNQKHTIESVHSKFLATENKDIMCQEEIYVDDCKGHGRIERRRIRVLPASVLEPEILEKWAGLEDGCIVELESTRVTENLEVDDKSIEYRYYFTSLEFKKEYIAKQLLYVIRSHWKIENKLHWILDVIYDQDMTHCNNNEFLKGKSVLNKLMYNLTTVFKRILEKERGAPVSRQSMKPIFTSIPTFLSMISKACILSATENNDKIL